MALVIVLQHRNLAPAIRPLLGCQREAPRPLHGSVSRWDCIVRRALSGPGGLWYRAAATLGPGGREGASSLPIDMNRRSLDSLLSTLRGWILLALGGVAVALLAWLANPHYPIREWLFWHYAGAWIATLVWAFGCGAVGHAILVGVLRRPFEPLRQLAIAWALGIFAFGLSVFVLALGQQLKPAAFFLLPAAFCLGAGPAFVRYLARVASEGSWPGERSRLKAWQVVPILLGMLGLGFIYFLILTPDNVQFDARWKHLAFAEDLVVSGGLRRYGEVQTFAVRPHFASYLYAWAFLAPTTLLFDRVVLAAHLEFATFVITTWIGIPAVVRQLAPRADARVVWATRFLFPGVFLYDSALSAGADHIGALFGPPIFLLLLASLRDLSPRRLALLAALVAAAAQVKETIAVMLAGVPLLILAAKALHLGMRALRGRATPAVRRNLFMGPAVAAACGLALSSPFWLKNWIWYGNPVYPSLSSIFRPEGLIADAEYLYEWGYKVHQFWRPSHDLTGVLETLKALFTWPFVPHDYGRFHGKRPIIGAVFTLLLPALFLFRRTGRLWLLVAWIHGSVFAWYWVHHQDRYLQALMPLIAAATAALLSLCWRYGKAPGRTGVLFLVTFQVIEGLDVYFIPTHAMIGGSAPGHVAELLGAAHRGKYDERFRFQDRLQSFGQAAPQDAIILVHEEHNILGLQRRTVQDFATWQYTLDYGALGNPRAVWQALRKLGVTHVLWQEGKSRSYDTIASDIVFHYLVERYTTPVAKHGGWRLAALAPSPPMEDARNFESGVAVMSCKGGIPKGIYQLQDLRVPSFGPRQGRPLARGAKLPSDPSGWPDPVRFAVVQQGCSQPRGGTLPRFRKAFTRARLDDNPSYQVYFRTDGE